MRYVIYLLLSLAFGTVIYNCTQINFSDLFAEKSKIALVCLLAALCVIALLAILLVANKIQDEVRQTKKQD